MLPAPLRLACGLDPQYILKVVGDVSPRPFVICRRQMDTLNVGLLSDTHIPHRLKWMPEAALGALVGVDLILHAGDVDDPTALEPLRTLAPVYAVRGNFHIQDLSDGGAMLPAVVELELAGQRVVLTHGHRPGPVGFCLKGLDVIGQHMGLTDNGKSNRRIARRLARLYPQADIIIFGHTHRAHVERVGHALLVNPGAVCVSPRERPSVARMRLSVGRPEVEIRPLYGPIGHNTQQIPRAGDAATHSE